VWRNTDSHAITDYLSNLNNSKYLSFISLMEELQLKDENDTEKLVRDFSSTLLEQEAEQEEGDESAYEDEEESSNKSIDRPWLGLSITDLTSDLAEDRGLPKNSEGVAVQSVIPGSPAFKAGIKGILLDVDKQCYLVTRGDVIISIDGEDIENTGDLEDIMEDKKVGDLINVGLVTLLVTVIR
jgi:S1-C subfamily serine protease